MMYSEKISKAKFCEFSNIHTCVLKNVHKLYHFWHTKKGSQPILYM